jgi:YidC/Oxa1 family membrane protein insertase
MIPMGKIPIFSSLEDAFRWFLTRIHEFTGFPWAYCIIILTVLVRLALVPLFVKQMKSSQQMQALAPKIKALQAKHKGDRKKLQEEQMKLYQEHSVNPFGACLPLVFQMPIFFALYLVLRGFSKHPPGGDFSFLGGFIPNITIATDKVGWQGIVLIVLYVASQAGSTLLMPNTMPAQQRYMFLALPFVFVIFVIRFPVGLMLYWITTNLWTVGQQFVLRKLMPAPVLTSNASPVKGSAKGGGGGSSKGGGGTTPKGGGSTPKGGGSTKGGGGNTPKGGGSTNGRTPRQPRRSPTRPKT